MEEAATRALVAAGKDAAERAADKLLSPDGEGGDAGPDKPGASKRRWWKRIGVAVLVLFVVIGVIGMLISYWHWFLLAGVAGLAGAFGWRRFKRRRAAKKGEPEEKKAEAAPEPVVARVAAPAVAAARVREEAAESARREAEERARDARAREEAAATEEQEVEDELAAMKARLKR